MAASPVAAERPDLTGYWKLVKTEQYDEFLRDLGFPWVVRKAAVKFGSSAIDLILHTGPAVKITSLNAKGSWARTYDTEREVNQKNAEGIMCRTTAAWEGPVLRTRLESKRWGTCESLRYLSGDILVVKTCAQAAAGREAIMFWFFERMQGLQRYMSGGSRAQLGRQIAEDQRRVEKATKRDTQYLQQVLLDWGRWQTPADGFLGMAAPSYPQRGSRARLRSGLSPGGSPRALSPGGMSKTPSSASLANLAQEVRSELHRSPEGAARPDRGGSQAGSLQGAPSAEGLRRLPTGEQLSRPASSAGALAAEAAAADGASSSPRPAGQAFAREISLTGPGGDMRVPTPGSGAAAEGSAAAASPPTESPYQAAAAPGSALPPLPSSGSVGKRLGEAAATAAAAPPPTGLTLPAHRRAASADSVGAAARSAAAHARSPSAVSPSEARNSSPNRLTPRSTPTHRALPAGTTALMAYKVQEFVEARGIMAVIPVSNPNDTSEPQLLGMSPEQAEETAAKLRDLETDMLISRQRHTNNIVCCCLAVSFVSDSLPDHLRVWESSMDI